MGFEKEGSKWMLVMGELRIHLKGGLGTIKSLETVLKGTSNGYEGRQNPEELFARLCKILPEEDALNIIKTAKEMGKLAQALNGGKSG